MAHQARPGAHRRRPPRRRWAPGRLAGPGLGLAAVLLVAVPFVGSASAGLTAAVRNGSSAAATGSLQLSAAMGGTVECATSIAIPAPACTGALPPAVLSTTGAQGQITTVSATGSLAPTSMVLTEGSCGPVPLLDSRTTADPMLIRGAVTDKTPSVFADGAGITLDGNTGYASDVVATASPQNFSEAIWFKTTAAGGGSLMGFSSTPGTVPGNWDRMMWIDPAGKVVFGVYNGVTNEVTSATAVNNGAWHLAVGTVSSTTGMSLNIDGQLLPLTVLPLVTTAETDNGYWHAGWENENNSWPDPPTTPYLAGSLTDAAVFPALTATQIATLRSATTQATWNGFAAGGSGVPAATHSWQLGDDATGLYAGSPTWYSQLPCSRVDVAVQTTAGTTVTCASPAQSGACPTPTSAVTLASLVGKAVTLTSPTPTQSIDLKLITSRETGTAIATALIGLHLNVTDSLVATAGGFTASLTWPAGPNLAYLT